MPPVAKRRVPAAAKAITSWAEQLVPQQLLCRDLGHNWKPSRVFPAKNSGFVQVLRCTQCRALRRRVIGRDGQILGAAYTYPDGYLAPTGVFATSADGRSQLRLVSLQRMLNDGLNEIDSEDQGQ